jgi:hypothetical protein
MPSTMPDAAKSRSCGFSPTAQANGHVAAESRQEFLPRVHHCQPHLSDAKATRAAYVAFEEAQEAVDEAVAKLQDLARTGEHRVSAAAHCMAGVLKVWSDNFSQMFLPLRVNGKWVR